MSLVLILLVCCAITAQSQTPSEVINTEQTTQEEYESDDKDLRSKQVTVNAATSASFDQVLQALCSVVGIGLTIDTSYRPSRKLLVFNGALKDVLDNLCGSYLTWTIRNRHLYISTARYIKHHRVSFPPSQTKIWTEIDNALVQILGDKSYLTINAENGILIINASNVQHQQIAMYLTSLERQQTTQTCISVTVIKVESSRAIDTGTSWSSICDSVSASVKYGSPHSIEVAPSKPVLTAICNALEAHGRVRTASNAIVSATNNRKATLQIDNKIVYFVPETTTVPNKRTNTQIHTHKMSTANTGTLLHITPTTTNDGVILDLHFCVSSQFGSTENPEHGKVPLINKQLIETTVHLRSKRGILLGGLLATCTKKQHSGLRILSRLPLLGALFGTTKRLKKHERIYIYIQLLPNSNVSTSTTKPFKRKQHAAYKQTRKKYKIH